MTAPVDLVAVVVLSYNGLEDTRKCLGSLANALRPGIAPILVDNGSTDGTSDMVRREFPWCRIVRVEVNCGPVVGNNAGLEAAIQMSARWVVLLNNDTTVDPALLDRLREAATVHADYAVIGSVIKFMDDPDVVMTDGCIFNPPLPGGFFLRKEVPLTESRPPRIVDVDAVNGCCMMVRVDILERIGLFEESFFMYHDELDLCLRVNADGGKCGVIDHALVWHKGSATSKPTGKRSIRYFDARNLFYVLRKFRWATMHGRSRRATAWVYLRYMFHWYCAERETGADASAIAVVDGVYDGLLGTRGPYRSKRRLFAAPIRWSFDFVRWLAPKMPWRRAMVTQ